MGFFKLFDGDDHALTANLAMAETMLCAFAIRCGGVDVSEDENLVVLRT